MKDERLLARLVLENFDTWGIRVLLRHLEKVTEVFEHELDALRRERKNEEPKTFEECELAITVNYIHEIVHGIFLVAQKTAKEAKGKRI